ncbi:hypothetical protein ACFOY8_12930 [Thalassospira xianhensis]|uniref:DUF922 domain-containing protein n=1 Tax=Thalassospira xianhensis MCCC 1A02616 TaxID=1177929 RepID=A0A367UKL1_9PROT|nr:hypothetical protein [Thalassospira xianhensis]RCK07874.1 hypothetical protein TH5_02360 [Thalassospira xianhensis MCCC 1A02616]
MIGFLLLCICPIALILAAICVIGFPALASVCEQVRVPIDVDVHVLDPNVVEDYSKSRDEIAAISGSTHVFNRAVMGLTSGMYKRTYNVKIRSAQEAGGYCSQPVKLDVIIGFKDLTVYIDKRYKPGSCQFNGIRNHEYRHVDVNKQTSMAHAVLLKARLNQLLWNWVPTYTRSRDEGRAQTIAQIDLLLDALDADLTAKREIGHANIDRPGSIRMTQSQCLDW